MAIRNDKTIAEEARREYNEHPTDSVTVVGPFDPSPCPDLKSRKLYKRNGEWMVRCSGYWCKLTGVKIQMENPRIVTFLTEARNSYR